MKSENIATSFKQSFKFIIFLILNRTLCYNLALEIVTSFLSADFDRTPIRFSPTFRRYTYYINRYKDFGRVVFLPRNDETVLTKLKYHTPVGAERNTILCTPVKGISYMYLVYSIICYVSRIFYDLQAKRFRKLVAAMFPCECLISTSFLIF